VTGSNEGGGLRVAVLGLGYVGLPLVRACVAHGHTVVGFDTSAEKVDGLRAGRSHVDDVADAEVADWLDRGFRPTTDPDDLAGCDVFVICVPTPLTRAGGPDLSSVEAATRTVEASLTVDGPRTPLVVLESTTYPGTTEEVVRPLLEKNGLRAGVDFHLAFSPERIDPGNATWTFENTPKVVGGLTPACADAAAEFYAPITGGVVRTRGLKEAEMAKLLENTYRHVNIALVNELWKLSHELGIDIWDVIDAASTKPYGFQAFRPGPGVGGHCIPIDPNYLSHRVKSELGQPFRFVELAQEINAGMPEFVVRRAAELLNDQGRSLKGSAVLVLGVAYKKDIADVRESPALPLIAGLQRRGAVVSFDDPLIDAVTVGASVLTRVADRDAAIASADLVVLVQDHTVYLDVLERIDPGRLLDTRGVTR
jgi:nucleotide sugar dehydrogenase